LQCIYESHDTKLVQGPLKAEHQILQDQLLLTLLSSAMLLYFHGHPHTFSAEKNVVRHKMYDNKQ